MCGIAGIYSASGLHEPEAALARVGAMCAAMRHRGPDDAGVFLSHDRQVVLGNVRLAIIDLTPAGHMPMASEDGSVCITYNGEIYNFAELREELAVLGHSFRSSSDTEVVLRAYLQWGTDCVRRFRGMFALALWDASDQLLFLVRDRMGIKPLCYALNQDGVVFASELRGLWPSERIARAIDPTAMIAYLADGSVPCPSTIYAGVRSLLPSHMLLARRGGIDLRSYWELPKAGTGPVVAEEARAQVRERLQEAVRLQLVSDVPLGAFLSGGIDSSAVVGLMRGATNGVIRTCSVVFDEARYDERPYARAVAEAHGCEHIEVEVTGEEVRDELSAAIGSMDQPTVDGINTYLVSRAARQAGLTVALSGLGGDELFGGYHTFTLVPRVHRAAQLAGLAPFLASPVASALRRWPVGSGPHRMSYAFAGQPSLGRSYRAVRGVFGRAGARALLSPELAEEPYGYEEEPNDWRELHPWDAVARLELRRYMHDQLLRDADAMSMAHSLEVRVPLLDERLVEYVLGLPMSLRAAGGTSKGLLRAAVDDLLPSLVRDRTRKQGFTFPFDVWLRAPLGPALAEALESAASNASVFRRGAVERLRADYQAGRVHWSRVWAVAVLELWLRQEQERAAAPPVPAQNAGAW